MGSVALGAAGPRTATPISPRPPPGEGSGGNFLPQLCGTPHLIVNPRLHRPLAGDRQIKLAFGSILSQNAARAAGKKMREHFLPQGAAQSATLQDVDILCQGAAQSATLSYLVDIIPR